MRAILRRHAKSLIILFGVWGSYFTVLFANMIQMRPDGLYLGNVNVWSDWALHISLANIFAYKPMAQWFAYHPLLSDGKMTYPFVADMISGFLMRAGLSLPAAFIWPSIITSFAMLLGLYFFFYLLLKSQKQALTALTLFFLAAGFGFLWFLRDFSLSPHLATILFPPQLYGRFDQYQWYASNFIEGMLVPQRAFLLGLTVALWGLILLFVGMERPVKRPWLWLVSAGVLIGFLPVIHPHSLIAVFVISGAYCLAQFKNWRRWLWYALPAAVIAGTLYGHFIFGGIVAPFVTWHPGYTAHNLGDWIVEWILIFGSMIPIAVFGLILIWPKIPPAKRAFWLGFFVLFTIGNLVLFQPVAWDNSKIFLWTYLGFAGLATAMIAEIWRQQLFGRIMVVIVVVILCFTGLLEVVRMQRVDKNALLETNSQDIALGEEIRAQTSPQAIFLTAPQHNHFIMMWASRPIFLGFTPWVMNFGFEYLDRLNSLPLMYSGGAETNVLLKKYAISYVVIGPTELGDEHANEAYFASNFPLAFSDSNYRVYDVRSLLR